MVAISAPRAIGAQDLAGEMRREKGRCHSRRARNSCASGPAPSRVEQPVLGSGLRRVFRARPQGAPERVLRDHAKRGGLGQGEFRGRFAEIDFAGGFDAFDVAAVGSEVEIGFHDLGLAVMALDLRRRGTFAPSFPATVRVLR